MPVEKMKTIEIRVESLKDNFDKFKEIFKKVSSGEITEKEEYISVSSIKDLNKLLTPKRIELLNYIKNHEVNSIKELSEKLRRDYKNVYADIRLFKMLGIIKLERKNNNLIPKILYDELDIKIPLNI
ncbi:hypothetical protein JCM14244_13290 [Venenivibrio stagnispumantis]